METPRSSSPRDNRNLWDDFRDSVRGGVRDLRNMGDELARQGRLRMDIFQTERRLRCAYEALGEAAFARLSQNQSIVADDPTVSELKGRINYYADELNRLRDEQRRTAETGE